MPRRLRLEIRKFPSMLCVNSAAYLTFSAQSRMNRVAMNAKPLLRLPNRAASRQTVSGRLSTFVHTGFGGTDESSGCLLPECSDLLCGAAPHRHDIASGFLQRDS